MTRREIKQHEHDILSACALRFDGYKFAELNRWDYDLAIEQSLVTGQLPDDPVQRQALFFMFQRIMVKWGGDRLPSNAAHWKMFRWLFLEVYDLRVPDAYRPEPHNDTHWPRGFDVPEAVRFIRKIHEGRKYRRYVPPTE